MLKREGVATMKKLVFPFVELEVPDDCPDGLDFEAAFDYFRERPELVEDMVRQYRKAYYQWTRTSE